MSRTRLWLGGVIVLALALAYNFVELASLPPGLDRDAAANGVMALQWVRAGLFPFWMPHASAPEPLIVWLQTATTAIMGPSVAALRSASALLISAAAVVVYALAWEVAKPFPTMQRWWAALLAGIVFACNPVVTQIARTGLRASTLPLFSGLFFLLLLRAWHTNARRDYVISGLALGAAAYTYLAARFLPIVIVFFVALAWWAERRQARAAASNSASFRGVCDEESPSASLSQEGEGIPRSARNGSARWLGLGMMVMTAFLVVLPQFIFFANYPMAFWERAQSVTLLSNPEFAEHGLVALLAEKLWAMLLMFGIEWSGQYNQAARPLLLPLPFAGLLLALPLVWRWRRLAPTILMVVALVVMLLPDLIGGDRVQPHELRVIGAFVPTIVLSGIGLAFALGWLVRGDKGKRALNGAGTLLALSIAVWGGVDWFGVAAPRLARSDYAWFARPDVAFAESIKLQDAPMLVPLNDYSRSIVAYLAADRIKGLQSGIKANGQVVQPSAARVLLLWPAVEERTRVESTSYRFDPRSLVLLDGDQAYLMPPARGDVDVLQQQCDAQPMVAAGVVAGEICPVEYAALDFPDTYSAPVWRVGDLFGEPNDEELRLRGISADRDRLAPGMEFGITSFWQPTRRTDDRWRYFVHVLDDHQTLVAGDDLIPGYGIYGARVWQTDEIVPVRQVVQLPDDLAPGRYWIEVGLYDPLDGARAVVDGTSGDGTAATRSLVGPLKVPLVESMELPDAVPLNARFGDDVALDGYSLARNEAGLEVTLRLSALRQLEHDYTVFVHVENAAGEMVSQTDAQPRDGLYPTSIWDAGERVVSTWQVALPAPLAPESYRVWIGLYEWQSGMRLPVQAPGATVDADRLLLDEIEMR